LIQWNNNERKEKLTPMSRSVQGSVSFLDETLIFSQLHE